jgi:citrate lyase subunit beta/citryl-CoA lyase
VTDTDALRASCAALRGLGFHGRSVIHPRQVPVVREAFAPTDPELDWATGVLDRAGVMDDDGVAAAALDDGSFVDPAIVRQARLILGRAAS